MIRCSMFFILALATTASWADKPAKKSEAWYYKLARILGVDRAPVSLKGPSSARPGELWIGPADHAEPRRLAEGSNFASPVFQPGGKFVYALQGQDLMQIPVAGGPAVKVSTLSGVIKLVGFDHGNGDRVLAVFAATRDGKANTLNVAFVSVKTGKLQVVAAGRPNDSEEAVSLLGWQRQYGEIYVRPQGSDVVVGGVGPAEIPISDCQNASCGQPSYSPELRQVVFVRSATLP